MLNLKCSFWYLPQRASLARVGSHLFNFNGNKSSCSVWLYLLSVFCFWETFHCKMMTLYTLYLISMETYLPVHWGFTLHPAHFSRVGNFFLFFKLFHSIPPLLPGPQLWLLQRPFYRYPKMHYSSGVPVVMWFILTINKYMYITLFTVLKSLFIIFKSNLLLLYKLFGFLTDRQLSLTINQSIVIKVLMFWKFNRLMKP